MQDRTEVAPLLPITIGVDTRFRRVPCKRGTSCIIFSYQNRMTLLSMGNIQYYL